MFDLDSKLLHVHYSLQFYSPVSAIMYSFSFTQNEIFKYLSSMSFWESFIFSHYLGLFSSHNSFNYFLHLISLKTGTGKGWRISCNAESKKYLMCRSLYVLFGDYKLSKTVCVGRGLFLKMNYICMYFLENIVKN